jgi:Novel STAND NTPase 1
LNPGKPEPYRLRNPFTPSEIAGKPEDFFGRSEELSLLEASLERSSVAIQGPIGIGKSSLLARGLLLMDGFASAHDCKTVIAVGDRDVDSVDSAARLLVESMIEVDEKSQKLKFKLGGAEWESGETVRYFTEGRHLAVLKRLVEKETLSLLVAEREYLLLAIDEADKCPVPLTRLVRSLLTHTQQQGVGNVRFVLAGVSPFFQEMVEEDGGIARFFRRTISLATMARGEAEDLMAAKLSALAEGVEADGFGIEIDPNLVSRMIALSGGHPHLLQLLGSHVVENENEDPDGILDSRDLVNALSRIAYEDRAQAYNSTIHMLEVNSRLEALRTLLGDIAPGFPTRITRDVALRAVGRDVLQWFVDRNILSTPGDREYGLVDEFLRIRLKMDDEANEATAAEIEQEILSRGWLDSPYDQRYLEFDED